MDRSTIPPASKVLCYYDRLVEKAEADGQFSAELFSGLCTDFNHALKLAEGYLRVEISKNMYGLIVHHHVHVLGHEDYDGETFLLSPKLIETATGIFCATYNFPKDAPEDLQKVLYIYMKDCMHVLSR